MDPLYGEMMNNRFIGRCFLKGSRKGPWERDGQMLCGKRLLEEKQI
jgi:hypothetical protein